jgi:hypothetical protein
VEAGFAVAAVDKFGTGASTRPPNGDDAGLAPMADANTAVAVQLRSRFPRVPGVRCGIAWAGAFS